MPLSKINEYSAASARHLETCHDKLALLFMTVLPIYDHKILQGHRGKDDQNKAFYEGRSKLKWPHGRHNRIPSMAVDVAPWPILWPNAANNERERRMRYFRFYHFAGVVLGTAASMGLSIRWGGDWDGDRDFRDQTFNDLVHYELIGYNHRGEA